MFFTTLDRFRGQFLNDPDAANRATQDQYLDALLGSEVFCTDRRTRDRRKRS